MTKKDCSQINWTQADTGFLADNWSWCLPQISALIASLPLVHDGLVRPGATAVRLRDLGSVRWPNGVEVVGFRDLWRMLQTTPRGTIMKGTQNGLGSRYNSGVPLLLSCWREHRGVKYSHWDWSDPHISAFVDRDVLALVRDLQNITVLQDDLLEVREAARLVKTGVKSGSLRSLTSVVPFGGLGSETFQNLTRLSKYCVTQTWIYHPSVRHPYQICGADLDNHPPPLVIDEVLNKPKTTTRGAVIQPDNPFDL